MARNSVLSGAVLTGFVTGCVLIQVEMFGVTADETGKESSELLGEFVSLQKELFSALELHYRSGHARLHHIRGLFRM